MRALFLVLVLHGGGQALAAAEGPPRLTPEAQRRAGASALKKGVGLDPTRL
jgi:hypothetical protein